MGESFNHGPPGWIRQSRKRYTQSIHNHMVVDYRAMSSVRFAIHDFFAESEERATNSVGDVSEIKSLGYRQSIQGSRPVRKNWMW